jgi:hypothetical protein
MAEVDSPEIESVEHSPRTARKVPQDYALSDDAYGSSPPKPLFGGYTFQRTNETAHATNSRRSASDATSLPPLDLGPARDSPRFPHSDNGALGDDAFDYKEMKRHLMDVESSFLPAPSPVGNGSNPGIDDTYLFDSTSKARQETNTDTPTRHAANTQLPESSDNSPSDPSTPADMYQTPAPSRAYTPDEHGQVEAEYGNTTSSLESMSSSPTAAAAARTISRAISQASMGNYDYADSQSAGSSPFNSDHDENETTPTKANMDDEQYKDHSTPEKLEEDEYEDAEDGEDEDRLRPSDAGHTPGAGLLSRRSSSRPRLTRSRGSSLRSSVSSFVTNPTPSEPSSEHPSEHPSETANSTDYALLAGGTGPGNLSRGSSALLSRTVSLGSMASGFEDQRSESARSQSLHSEPPETIDEEVVDKGHRQTSDDDGLSPPETPRAMSRTLPAPTDTVIAQHVRNVQVPESMAKEFRNQHRVSSPNKRSGISAPLLGRSGKTLTLREQSSTIERLSKENFDLKLKVMFLSDRLDKLSEEGVKEMINENVELKTGLAVLQRDNKALKRKIRDLERKAKEEEGRPDTAKSGASSDDRSSRWYGEGGADREEELIYLREKVEEYLTEIEKLRNDGVARENEKRKLAEIVRSLGERRNEHNESQDELDVWKELHEQEVARREAADDEVRRLREELALLKSDNLGASSQGGFHQNTYNYNNNRRSQASPLRPKSGFSERIDERTGTFSSASTLVDELQKENEYLRHENAELRREVNTQASMLTSRIREKEFLNAEIEQLKLGLRRGDVSIAGDSILERSVSRAHGRTNSRTSAHTIQNGLQDDEREEYEMRNAELRDKLNELRMQNQEFQREMDLLAAELQDLYAAKDEVDSQLAAVEQERDQAEQDVQILQADRDDALGVNEELENEFVQYQTRAQETVQELEDELAQVAAELTRTQQELTNRTEDFNSLQVGMRGTSEALAKLEEDQENHLLRIEELQQDLEYGATEMDAMQRQLEETEAQLEEANRRNIQLDVERESDQNEICFLRREQEDDKAKIGDLETNLKALEANLEAESERCKDLQNTLEAERHQHESVTNQEKKEVQRIINNLNKEMSAAKDEVRTLRMKLSKAVDESKAWKEKLTDLEDSLRHTLGNLGGSRSALMQVSLSFSLPYACMYTDLICRVYTSFNGISRRMNKLSRTPRLRFSKRTACSSNAIRPWKTLLLRLARSPNSWRRNVKHTGQPSTNLKPFKEPLRLQHAQCHRTNLEWWNSRQHVLRSVKSSTIWRLLSKKLSPSVITCCSLCGAASRLCAVLTGPIITA